MPFLKSSIAEIPGVRVLGSPTLCIVAFEAAPDAHFHVYSLADDLKEKGWLFSCLQYPTWYADLSDSDIHATSR